MSTIIKRSIASKNVLRLATNNIKNTSNNPIKITQVPSIKNLKVNNQKIEANNISKRNLIPKNKLSLSIFNKTPIFNTKGKSTTHFKKI